MIAIQGPETFLARMVKKAPTATRNETIPGNGDVSAAIANGIAVFSPGSQGVHWDEQEIATAKVRRVTTVPPNSARRVAF